VSDASGINIEDLINVRVRSARVTSLRQLAMYMARRNGFTFGQIAQKFGCQRSAVVYAVKRASSELERAQVIEKMVTEVVVAI
jgi:chromosomal replication initiation ATPase DnaA